MHVGAAAWGHAPVAGQACSSRAGRCEGRAQAEGQQRLPCAADWCKCSDDWQEGVAAGARRKLRRAAGAGGAGRCQRGRSAEARRRCTHPWPPAQCRTQSRTSPPQRTAWQGQISRAEGSVAWVDAACAASPAACWLARPAHQPGLSRAPRAGSSHTCAPLRRAPRKRSRPFSSFSSCSGVVSGCRCSPFCAYCSAANLRTCGGRAGGLAQAHEGEQRAGLPPLPWQLPLRPAQQLLAPRAHPSAHLLVEAAQRQRLAVDQVHLRVVADGALR